MGAQGGRVPRDRILELIAALGIFVTTSCGHGMDSTGPGVVASSTSSVTDRIAFVQNGSSDFMASPSSVVVMHVDGSGLKTVYSGGVLGHPRWSPDGSKLAFFGQSVAHPAPFQCWWYDPTCQDKIFVIDPDGPGALIHLTDSLAWHSADPEWSPDGSRIAFTYRFDVIDDAPSIEVMNADGSGKRRVAYPPSWSTDLYIAPTWSPDGRSLAFQFVRFVGDTTTISEILIMDLASSKLRTLVPWFAIPYRWSATGASGPAWSPDGSRLVFRNENGLAEALVDGSAIAQLTGDTTDGMAAWTPQGRILFTRVLGGVSRILLMNADGSGVAMLPQPAGNNYWPSWSP
jgi:Tol biopolymer transport system component